MVSQLWEGRECGTLCHSLTCFSWAGLGTPSALSPETPEGALLSREHLNHRVRMICCIQKFEVTRYFQGFQQAQHSLSCLEGTHPCSAWSCCTFERFFGSWSRHCCWPPKSQAECSVGIFPSKAALSAFWEENSFFRAWTSTQRDLYSCQPTSNVSLLSLFCSQGGGINKMTKQKLFNAEVTPAPLFFKYLANLGEREDQNAG